MTSSRSRRARVASAAKRRLADAGEPVEALRRRPRAARPSTQTVRSDATGASCRPSTRFQATGSPVASDADAGRPPPRRAARVVAGGLVDEPAPRRPRAPERTRPRTAHAAVLARPDVLRAVRGDDLDRRRVADLERQHAGHLARARASRPRRRRGAACARVERCARRSHTAHHAAVAGPIRATAAHSISSRPERADPRPALERAAAAPARHALRRQRQLGPARARTSPRAQRFRHARTICSGAVD